jgi:hypothetical protein
MEDRSSEAQKLRSSEALTGGIIKEEREGEREGWGGTLHIYELLTAGAGLSASITRDMKVSITDIRY